MRITEAEYHNAMAACSRICPRLAPHGSWLVVVSAEAELDADHVALNIVAGAWACNDSVERRFYDRAMRVIDRERAGPA